MSWLRARVLPITGVLCLAGQGTLLYLAGTGAGAPRLPWPALFLALSLSLPLSLLLSLFLKIIISEGFKDLKSSKFVRPMIYQPPGESSG